MYTLYIYIYMYTHIYIYIYTINMMSFWLSLRRPGLMKLLAGYLLEEEAGRCLT